MFELIVVEDRARELAVWRLHVDDRLARRRLREIAKRGVRKLGQSIASCFAGLGFDKHVRASSAACMRRQAMSKYFGSIQ